MVDIVVISSTVLFHCMTVVGTYVVTADGLAMRPSDDTYQ